MAQKLDENEMVSFKELLMANSIQVDRQFDKGRVEPSSYKSGRVYVVTRG